MTGSVLTYGSFRRMLDEALAMAPPPRPRVHFSASLLKDSAERLFPVSKNRSKRLHKKLVKRLGSEFRQVPAMFRVGNDIYAHPTFRERLKANGLGD